MKNSIKYIISLAGGMLMFFAPGVLTGCIAEPRQNPDEDFTVYVDLAVPGLNQRQTRTMSEASESAIDYNGIQVLVFEDTGLDEVFRYKAEITGSEPQKLTIKVRKSQTAERYRFVIIANADVQTVISGTPKSTAMSQFIFDCIGKWNASDTDPDLIPMWGEYEQPVTIKANGYMTIRLHRALARVDIGNLFKFLNNDPDTGAEYEDKETDKESVWGLDNFDLQEIRVYRTLNKAYAASSADRINGQEVFIPNIPASARYNSGSGTGYDDTQYSDLDPLLYILPARGDSFIRNIYIPESVVIGPSSNMDDVPCIVIGGYYGTSPDITYYRADFADYNNGVVSAYRPILRNHRYVFDIRSVNGPGFKEPEQALNSISSEMTLNVVEWNEVPLDFYVQGSYFFDIDTREVWLEARPFTEDAEISYTVPYRTNLNMNESSKPFVYTWESSGNDIGQYFDVAFDYMGKTIRFIAKQENVNTAGGILSDKLIVNVENFQFTITVNQKVANLDYTMDCSSVTVNGRYRVDVPMNYTNFISMKIRSAQTLINQDYEVYTAEKNGIYFRAEGTFDTNGTFDGVEYVYDLILAAHGTLKNLSGEEVLLPFDVTILSNSINPMTCTARVIVGYSSKKILTIGANASYLFGYVLEPNTASRAFVDANINFGTDINSTVTMEKNAQGTAFTIEYITRNQGMTGESIDINYLRDKLENFKPDIILTGQAISYSSQDIAEIRNFVDNGGVFLMFNEYYPSVSSTNAMVEAIMGSAVGTGSNQPITNLLFSLPAGAAYEDDPILNGPFGDMRNLQWGSDGTIMHGFPVNDPDQMIVYSTRTDGTACMFRHKTKPFMYIGDGGFISNSRKYIGNSYQGSYVYFPFAIDNLYRPVARINYTSSTASVYNSQIFGNIITWAVKYSEHNP